MSRTKRYVPHWVIENELHPWTDPDTGEPWNWARNEHQILRARQRELARLRGDDGHCPQWRDYWSRPIDRVRTGYKRLINEGIEDHFDAQEDYGKIFNWQGVDINGVDTWYEQMASEYKHQLYLDELAEEEAREAEYERREMEMDDYYDLHYEDFPPYY